VNAPVRLPSHDTPLRLADAATLAFPMGGVTAATLRGEAKRGRLKIYRIGGRDFTTLQDIADMTKACSVRPNGVPKTPLADTSRALAAARDALDRL
jgi:uncharacterized protein YbjT (DUF2867 family)